MSMQCDVTLWFLVRQEGVKLGAYSPAEVSVWTRGQELDCRTYIMNSCVYAPPSPQYLKVVVASLLLRLFHCHFTRSSRH